MGRRFNSFQRHNLQTGVLSRHETFRHPCDDSPGQGYSLREEEVFLIMVGKGDFIYVDKIQSWMKEEIGKFPEILAGERAEENLEKENYIAIAMDTETNKVVGYILLEPAFLDNYSNIQYLEVLEGYQNRGIGRHLIDKVVQYVKNKGEKAITVSSYSQTANYYKGLGFLGEGMLLKKDINSGAA